MRFNDDRNLDTNLVVEGEMLMYNNYFQLDCDLKKDKGFEILNSWKRDYGDIAYNVLLYENQENIANVIVCMDESIGTLSEKLQIKEIKEYLDVAFEDLKSLPKLSQTSNLMQEVVDSVCESEADICHITKEDWLYLKETYNDVNLKVLKNEVEKYNLSNQLEVGSSTDKYVIVGYGDLPTLFNDDRNLSKKPLEVNSSTIQQKVDYFSMDYEEYKAKYNIQDEENENERDYGMEL